MFVCNPKWLSSNSRIGIFIADDIPALNEHLTKLQQRLNGDLTPLMSAIGSVLESSTRQRFADKKDPSGVAWAVLMPSTIKAKNGRSTILVDSGDLIRSITFHASNDSVVIGTDRPYGKYHQTGTKLMPQRAFLGLSAQDNSDIGDLINDFLAGSL